MTDVTVITPTRSGREVVLLEAVDSVQAQTHPAAAHFVGLDADRAGPAAMRNALLGEVLTPLVAFLDDDDLLDPAHLETLLSEMERSGADVAWSWHRTEGRTAVSTPRPRNDRDMRRYMRQGRNVIPVTVLARLDAINEAGGFQSADRYEDYSLWCRMLDLGARFSLVKRETWTYRFLDDNRTWEGS
jgi:glycosyltransferase involved in cell wall biosynthesis